MVELGLHHLEMALYHMELPPHHPVHCSEAGVIYEVIYQVNFMPILARTCFRLGTMVPLISALISTRNWFTAAWNHAGGTAEKQV